MKKDIQTKKTTIYQEIIENERKAFPNVTDKAVNEINTLLDSTMSSKEMTKSEITTIADRLIKFQDEENVSQNQKV